MGHGKVKGIIGKGNAIGRELGYPTANIYGVDDLDTRDGVYAVTARIGDGEEEYRGIANLGFRPTVESGSGRVLEFHLFGFSGDIYGKEATVSLHRFIRSEQVFGSAALLRQQIIRDENTVKEYFRQQEKNK